MFVATSVRSLSEGQACSWGWPGGTSLHNLGTRGTFPPHAPLNVTRTGLEVFPLPIDRTKTVLGGTPQTGPGRRLGGTLPPGWCASCDHAGELSCGSLH